MMYLEDWKVRKVPDLPHNPKKNGLYYLFYYGVDDALTMLTSPNWTRALFVRDPRERTLSAYLDKGLGNKGRYIQRHCCHWIKQEIEEEGKSEERCVERAHASFLGFLEIVQKCPDPHWAKQSNRIDEAFQRYINFVGRFDQIHSDTKRLLDRLSATSSALYVGNSSLWTRFGASGWGSNGMEEIFSEATSATHQTSANTKLEQYFNSSVEALFEKLYIEDYDNPLLNFTRPSRQK
jgi:hypothetical protein